MSWLDFLKGRSKRSTTNAKDPHKWFVDWWTGGAKTSSGVSVNESSALTYTPFWAAVRVISGAVASLPLITYKRVAAGKERAPRDIPYTLLHDRANPFMSAMKLRETLQNHALTYGNGYANIERDGGGRPIALWPLLPNRTARKIDNGGLPYYEVYVPGDAIRVLPDDDVLHIYGLGFDGLSGYNVVRHHKEAIGLGMATKQYGAALFGNGAIPGGTLEHPEKLSDEAAKRLKVSWEAAHQGLDQSHRVAILEEGMKWNQTGISPEDAQCLETQKFSVDDIARIFNIPPHKLASMDRATFSNIEQQSMDFLTQTLYYWLRTWETECNSKLISPSKQGVLFVEHLVDGFLRGDLASRYAAYNVGRNGGWLNVNDIRGLENMNSIGPEGDIYLEPLNMRPAGSGGNDAVPVPMPANTDDQRNLYEECWRGLLTKESKAIQRLAAKPDTLLSKGMRWYTDHQGHIYRVIEPALRAAWGPALANLMAQRIAERYTVKAIETLESCIDKNEDIERAMTLAEELMPPVMAMQMIGAHIDGNK